MARRRKLTLEDVRVEVKLERAQPGETDKAASVIAAGEGRAIKRGFLKTVTIKGDFSERDRAVLKNASKHCPVAQLFDGRSAMISEEVVFEPSA